MTGVYLEHIMDLYEKIKDLVEMMKNFDLSEIEIKDGEKEIKIRKGCNASEVMVQQVTPMAMGGIPVSPQPAAQPAPAAEAKAAKDPNLHEFTSPMVGTFYRAPSPESPPYATEGDKINSETIICIIEAMKVMNEIKAEMSGEIVEILVENGEAVEFGQPLFMIRRAG
jgi:acetyl-CoA carboxylase biotin carboxyl carrier protein